MNKNKQVTKRNGMVLYHLWLTVDEDRVLSQHMEALPSFIWGLMKTAKDRGDFKKYSKDESPKGINKSYRRNLKNDNSKSKRN